MARIKGYYWIKVSYYSGWHVAYWDGVGWLLAGRDINDKSIDLIAGGRILEPGEKEVTNG